MTRLLVASLTALCVFGLVVGALLTNWFRYSPSLEALFVLVPLSVIVVLGIALHIWALRATRRRRMAVFASMVSVLGAVAMTAVLTNEAYGGWFPRLAADHVDRNAEQVTRAVDGTPVTYHLELRNPFARNAKAYVVGMFGAQAFRIQLPIGPLGGYGDAIRPEDWITLGATRDPNVFKARVTVDPGQPRSFLIDLDSEQMIRAE